MGQATVVKNTEVSYGIPKTCAKTSCTSNNLQTTRPTRYSSDWVPKKKTHFQFKLMRPNHEELIEVTERKHFRNGLKTGENSLFS